MSAAQPQICCRRRNPHSANLAYNLESEGFDVRRARMGGSDLLVAEALPDLVILDWMMPLLKRDRGLSAA